MASESYLGEIRMFAGNFAPRGFMFCQGQLLDPNDYTALFSLLGTTYGGNGTTTFALPNFKGRIPLHFGTGPGLHNRVQGDVGGAETVALTMTTTPTHTHLAAASSSSSGAVPSPAGNVWSANANSGAPQFAAAGTTPAVTMAPTSVSNNGSGIAHDNMAPTLALNFIIQVEGIYPSQN